MMAPAVIRASERTPAGGRVFFSSAGRSLIEEDQIELTSVGVDIGSSTSHLLFSTIVLERADTRYIVAERRILRQSEILLTPYRSGDEIDADALGEFIAREYEAAGLTPDAIDTGALILTGVAVRRRNARAIGELFSAQTGKFVAVSAGDALETLMAAQGSGAAALSTRSDEPVMNIDIGGGTTKIALCVGGEVAGMTAVEAGARLIAFDGDGRVAGIEPYGRRHIADAGLDLAVGDQCDAESRRRIAESMARRILAAARGAECDGWLRLPPLSTGNDPARVVFSGGVSEFINGNEPGGFGDLGPELATAMLRGIADWGKPVTPAVQGIRATVVGASQYTVQVSGSTIFLDPSDVLPLRNIPVVAPVIDLSDEEIDSSSVAAAIHGALARLDLGDGEQAVALALPWQGSATFHRLHAVSRGIIEGLDAILDRGVPLVMVVGGDVGGLIGMHCREEQMLANPIVSIDGIELKEFDFIDIGEVIRATGSVPVVIKSLLFPSA